MFVLIRALTWASLFIGFVLVYFPARLLSSAGVAPVPVVGAPQLVGFVVAGLGAAVAVWCILTFAIVGKGTPAPFDPPRRLVVRGPYRFVRNPMYLGAALALLGAALVYESGALLAYAAAFFVVTHIFVMVYEEPTLRARFGEEYAAYCRRVRRWWPGP